MKYANVLILIAIFFLLPTPANAKVAVFLKPEIEKASKQLVCFDTAKTNCQVVFTISGKRFLNSQDAGSMRVGSYQAKILRWTDTIISASAPASYYDSSPVLKVDSTITYPTLETGNQVLDAMFESAIETAIANVHITDDGQRYFSAGPKYDDVARTYYRDSYWMAQLMLIIEPYVVRDEILLLAGGVEDDGSVPSALTIENTAPQLELWKDHYDSGPYLVMMVEEYLRFTGDESILSEIVGEKTVYETLKNIIEHLEDTDDDGDGLPEKPKDSLQDWLDTIPRGGEVLYDEALYYQALKNMSELAKVLDKSDDETFYHQEAKDVRRAINKQFWSTRRGYYYERCEEGACVDRLTDESSLAILYGIPTVKNRKKLFESLEALETRNNSDQPYGDWGVLNAWPIYYESDNDDYHYQNGTDWPFLDAMNAGARLKYSNDGWEYPLTRWWTYLQEENRDPSELPEFVSPVDDSNGTSQAWSVAPIMAAIKYGLGLDPDFNGFYSLREPPWGETTGSNFVIHGERVNF